MSSERISALGARIDRNKNRASKQVMKHLVGASYMNDPENKEFTPYDANVDYSQREETYFYYTYYKEYLQNEWFSWPVDYLAMHLFSGFEFDGAGAEDCYKFFDEICLDSRDQILEMGKNVVRDGNGGLDKIRLDGKLVQIRRANGQSIRITKDEYGNEIFTQLDNDNFIERIMAIKTKPEDYRMKKFAICRLRTDPNTPYGIGFGRSCIHIFQGLRVIDRDILAGVKKLMSNIYAVAAELEGYDTEAEKLTALTGLTDDFEGLQSSTQGLVAHDKKHELYMPGVRGGGGQRVLAVMDIIEPIMSAYLMNFLIGIGVVEQTGANKSLIKHQKELAQKMIQLYTDKVARFLQIQIIPEITDKKVKVIFPHLLDIDDLLSFTDSAVISKSYTKERLGIVDKGTDYVEQKRSSTDRGMDDNSDEPTSKRTTKADTGGGGET